MRPTLATLVLITLAAPALAQPAGPPFQGPAVHDGAWATQRSWSDPSGDDAANGSYAWAYRNWSRERADRAVETSERLDCADLSIGLLCEYAALNGLPLSWRVFNAPERRFVEIDNDDPQFAGAEEFRTWSQYYLGAMNLADNTYAITYEEWAGGDMILMDWNQTDESPNFEGRTVWHTYLVGVPGETIYYGNISSGNALPVTRTSGSHTLTRVREHPDRYGASPRRFELFRGSLWGPNERPVASARIATVVNATRLNLRAGPGTNYDVVTKALRGDELDVLGTEGRWVRIRRADGTEVWGHSFYLKVEDRPETVAANTGLLDGLESVETPAVETPEVAEPVAEAPVVVEEPVVEEPVIEEPVAEEPVIDEPLAEEPIAEEPAAEEPAAEEPAAEEPAVEEPAVEEPAVEEPAVEEPVREEPVEVEPVAAEPVADDASDEGLPLPPLE